MNPLEKLCLNTADELVIIADVFVRQFNNNPEIKLIDPMTLIVAEYKRNRNLLEKLTKAMPAIANAEGKE